MKVLIFALTMLLAITLTGCAESYDTNGASPAAPTQEEAAGVPVTVPRPVAENGESRVGMKEKNGRGEPVLAVIEPEDGSGEAWRSPGNGMTGAPAAPMEPGMPEPRMPEPGTMKSTPTGSMGDTEGNTTMFKSRDELMMPAAPPTDHSGSWTAGGRGGRPQYQPDLKAGDVDDNARWQEYLSFVEDYTGPPVNETSLSNRQIVTVLDKMGSPVPNASVTLERNGTKVSTQLTYADGRTLFFPGASEGMGLRGERRPGYTISVSRNGFDENIKLDAQGDDAHEISLDGTMEYGDQVDLDVLFLLDATGSMADEINQIKSTLQSISQQVSRLPANPDLRFGMVAYRDRGDEYVTRRYDFESNVERFQRRIQEVRADGGDDYPESMNQALHEAVNDMDWRKDSIRLIFLVADAPPHLDYAQDEDYAVDMVRAREAGIKIFSVASSGLDEQGERVMRQIAQQTMGRFLFILYESGPQGELDTPHDVEQYSVDQLDDLIVGIIESELAGLGQKTAENGGMQMK